MIAVQLKDQVPKNMNPPAKEPVPPDSQLSGDIGSILWESAVESFVRAILVLVMGSVAIGLVGGILHDMTPSLPPALEGRLHSTTKSFAPPRLLSEDHLFYIVFSVLLVINVRARLTGRMKNGQPSMAATRVEKICSELSKEWFGLIVGNAFGAMVSAWAVVWVQQFSLAQWCLHWLASLVLPAIQRLAANIFGPARADSIQGWFDWYDENQLKFSFWLLYLAAICDDLGIPNLKTLGRWSWRKIRNRSHRQLAGTGGKAC
jgi:hypothetical protein